VFGAAVAEVAPIWVEAFCRQVAVPSSRWSTVDVSCRPGSSYRSSLGQGGCRCRRVGPVSSCVIARAVVVIVIAGRESGAPTVSPE